MLSVLILLTFSVVCGQKPEPPTIKYENGVLEIRIRDQSGISLAAVHYSVNSPIRGTGPGKWNYDIRQKTGNEWVHRNSRIKLNSGDTLYYWIYVVRNRLGYQLTGQSWKVGSTGGSTGTGGTEVRPPTGGGGGETNTVAPPETVDGRYRLVFEDNFDGNSIDKSKWKHEISAWGGGNGEFQVYTPEPKNSYVRDGVLYLKPTLTADKFGESFVKNGNLDLRKTYGSCTTSHGCTRRGFINPIMSARVQTRVSFRYGKAEIYAKMPRGDWLWPALWFLPQENYYGGWPRSGEMDLVESRGNRDYGGIGCYHMASTNHWGVEPSQNRYGMTSKGKTISRTNTFADGFHKYVLKWDSTGIRTYVDDDEVLKVRTPSQGYYRWGNQRGHNPWAKGSTAAPFDRAFYLIMNVAVGGTNGFMPDGVPNRPHGKPWRNNSGRAMQDFYNAKSKWLSTWKGEDAAMQVKSVKIWELK